MALLKKNIDVLFFKYCLVSFCRLENVVLRVLLMTHYTA